MMLRRKFLVREEIDESRVRKIIDPILLGITRTTHKVTYRTSKGVVEYFSMSLGSGLSMYADAAVSGILRKIVIWNRVSVKELEDMLRSKGVEMVEIVKEGPRTLELRT
jgi:hypothetical protein